MVEQVTENHRVGGSIPSLATTFPIASHRRPGASAPGAAAFRSPIGRARPIVAPALKAAGGSAQAGGMDGEASRAIDRLWELAAAECQAVHGRIHGVSHWRRVERNGLWLAQHTGADLRVVRLFAAFHDSQRRNDDEDPLHGSRAARYLDAMRIRLGCLDEPQFELLIEACAAHSDGERHSHPTIATCWDADRLDLWRVGIEPDPRYLSTPAARELARLDRGAQDRLLAGLAPVRAA